MTEKERQLVQQLLEKTRVKAIPWEPTASDNEFVAPYKGHVTFTVSKHDDPSYYGDSFKLTMRDPGNREMLVIEDRSGLPAATGEEQTGALLATLYRAAHDSALKVEETLDAILDDLRAAS